MIVLVASFKDVTEGVGAEEETFTLYCRFTVTKHQAMEVGSHSHWHCSARFKQTLFQLDG